MTGEGSRVEPDGSSLIKRRRFDDEYACGLYRYDMAHRLYFIGRKIDQLSWRAFFETYK